MISSKKVSKILRMVGTSVALFLAFAIVAGTVGGDDIDGGELPGETTFGNNRSYPVIWAEGVTKYLRGTPGMDPMLAGEWWYQWGTNGTDPDVVPASCPPDVDNVNYCDDGVPEMYDETNVPGEPLADSPLPLAKAYLQKDPYNEWQAETWPADGTAPPYPVNVDLIDWGDNLESVNWYTRSQVRTEVVLFEDQIAGDLEAYPWPMLEYGMRHTEGWGIDEVHGLAASLGEPPTALLGPGTRATVYSHCARLTIQKLLVAREDLVDGTLTWEPGEGWTESEGVASELINPPIFNLPVYEGGDGPGYYSAEINVKGRVIYGYTWSVRDLYDDTPVPPETQPSAVGDYRITFSFDQECVDGDVTISLNTFFTEGVTEIMQPEETDGEEPVAGGRAVLDCASNLTYMDIRILERTGGPGSGGQHGGD